MTFEVREMLERIGVPISSCQTEIDDVHEVSAISDSHKKVVRFQISVDNAFAMAIFHGLDDLRSEHQHCLEREFSVTLLEKCLETGTEIIKNHDIPVAFVSISVYLWYARMSLEQTVNICLVF